MSSKKQFGELVITDIVKRWGGVNQTTASARLERGGVSPSHSDWYKKHRCVKYAVKDSTAVRPVCFDLCAKTD